MRILLCPPDYFRIDQEINVWMNASNQPNHQKARRQWQDLLRLYAEFGVELWFMEPQPDLQDMCFTANGGWCRWGKMIFSNFRHAIRKAEEPYYELWFSKYRSKLLNVDVVKLPSHIYFEGQGDVVTIDPSGGTPTVLMGYGQNRTDYEAAQHLARIHNLPQERVVPMRLVDPRFYHLDTACVFIPPHFLMYYPGAFDDGGLRVIEGLGVELIPVAEEDAKNFVCNGVFLEHASQTVLILNSPSRGLAEKLTRLGFLVRSVEMSEFLKSGGSARCLTLFLPYESQRQASS